MYQPHLVWDKGRKTVYYIEGLDGQCAPRMIANVRKRSQSWQGTLI
jgi:hypothetical protein